MKPKPESTTLKTKCDISQWLALLQSHIEYILDLRELHEARIAALKGHDAQDDRAKYASLCVIQDHIVDCIYDLRNGRPGENKKATIARATALVEEVGRLKIPDALCASESEERQTTQPNLMSRHRDEERSSLPAPPPPSDPTRITTGRHLRRLGPSQLAGVSSPEEASERFYNLTADTHGGKVRHGKRSGSYVTPGGKRVRKK